MHSSRHAAGQLRTQPPCRGSLKRGMLISHTARQMPAMTWRAAAARRIRAQKQTALAGTASTKPYADETKVAVARQALQSSSRTIAEHGAVHARGRRRGTVRDTRLGQELAKVLQLLLQRRQLLHRLGHRVPAQCVWVGS